MILNAVPSLENKTSSKGFTLTELAIVLGVFSLVVGGLWTALGAVNHKRAIVDLITNVQLIVDNAHKLYGGQTTSDLNDLQNQVNANIFPSNFLASTTISLPGNLQTLYGQVLPTKDGYYYWGGLEPLNIWQGQLTGPMVFEVDIVEVPDDVCTQLVMQMSRAGNVIDIEAPNNGWGPVYKNTAFTANSSPTLLVGVPLSVATQACNTGGAGTAFTWMVFTIQ